VTVRGTGAALRGSWAAGGPNAGGLGSKLALALGYIALYVTLDRISFVKPIAGLDITPWNPEPGLTLGLLVARGWAYLPAVLVAQLLTSRLVPLVAVPLPVALGVALVTSASYAAAAAALRRHLRGRPELRRTGDVVLFIAVTMAASGAWALGSAAIYTGGRLLPARDFAEAVIQLWIGDAIGVVVFAPLVLDAFAHGRPRLSGLLARPRDALEALLQLAGIGVVLFVVFGLTHDRYMFRLFYLLFLPLIWIAVRRGLTGASWAVLTIQIGLITALEFENADMATVRQFQMVMFAVAATGLMLGAAVTERHRALRALAESENRLAAIVNTAEDAVLTIDGRGRIGSANPAVERLFGHPAERIIGRDVRALVEAPEPLAILTPVDPAKSGQTTPWQLEGRRADGHPFPIEVTAGRFGQGEETQYTLVIRDVTVRRDTEMRMRSHESEMARGSRFSLADALATALAHEINQPLTAITTFARGCLRMIREPDPEKHMLREGIEHIAQQAERAGDIIVRLRDLVRGGASQLAATDVRVMLDAAVALIEADASEANVDVRFDVPADPPRVMADRLQIEQVLVNLLRNGIEAAAAAGAAEPQVVISVRPAEPGFLAIAVADSGPGISPEVARRLFEPFATTKTSGMGLGLPISRSIVEAHGGRLDLVRSGPEGSVFAFALPVAAAAEASA
jgi:two-component system sensor kinase FixL